MSKYFRKPLEIEAIQYNIKNAEEVAQFFNANLIPISNLPNQQDYICISIPNEPSAIDIWIAPNNYVFLDIDMQVKAYAEDFFNEQYEKA